MAGEENAGRFAYLIEKVKNYGLGPDIYNELKAAREKWRTEVINIAFVGQARQGKSSHINAHVGERVAEVKATGVCTTDITNVPHPQNKNIILWDVPGVDAVKFPRESYFEKIDYKKNNYDFFLIVTKDIFSSDAKFIADLVQKENKRFYLVRTHIDESIRNESEDHPEKKPEDVFAETKKNIITELETCGLDITRFKVYLVNNKKPQSHDFPKLLKDICQDCVSDFQREALILATKSYGSEIINMKYDMFRTRSWIAAVISGAGGAVPLPGVSLALDLGILVEETLMYFVGFGLTKKAIASFEQLNEVEVGTIENALTAKLKSSNSILYLIREKSTSSPLTWATIKTVATRIVSACGLTLISYLAVPAASEGVESVVRLVLPIVGSVIAGSISFGVTKYQLGKLLDETKEAALFVNSYHTN